MTQIKKYKRKAVFADLFDFCPLSGKDSYIEISEWHNGEGFDVDIYSKLPVRVQLTWGEFKAIKKLLKKLEEQDENL